MEENNNLRTKTKLPYIDILKCTRCEKCILICPTHAIIKTSNPTCDKCIKYCISMQVPCNRENYIFCYDLCDSCGLCISACKHDAIS
jgi:ferredoxin